MLYFEEVNYFPYFSNLSYTILILIQFDTKQSSIKALHNFLKHLILNITLNMIYYITLNYYSIFIDFVILLFIVLKNDDYKRKYAICS